MSVITIAGDIHLGGSLSLGKYTVSNGLNTKVLDRINLLNNILNTSIEYESEAIIFAGDIFDDINPNFRLVTLFLEFLKECSDNYIDVHIIVGNHDIKKVGSDNPSSLDIISASNIPRVYIYKSIKTILFDKIAVTLLPFRDRSLFNCKDNIEALQRLKDQLDYESSFISPDLDKILVGHLGIEGSLYLGNNQDYISHEMMCPPSIFSRYDYIWMGHIHKPQVFCHQPYVSHIGSIDITDFGEIKQNKYFIIFNSDKKKKFTKIRLPVRKLHLMLIIIDKEIDSTKYVLAYIKDYNNTSTIKNGIVRLDIILNDPDMIGIDRNAIENCIYDLGAYHICNLSESKSADVINTDKVIIHNSIDPKKAILLFADQEIFDSDNDKDNYIKMANEVIDRYYDS